MCEPVIAIIITCAKMKNTWLMTTACINWIQKKTKFYEGRTQHKVQSITNLYMCVEYSSRDLPHSENKHLLWDGIYLLAHDAQYDSFFHPAQKKTDKQMKMEPSNRYRIKLKTLVLTLSKFTRIRYVTIFQYKLFGCHINYIWYL